MTEAPTPIDDDGAAEGNTLDQLIQVRRDKVTSLRERGIEPYASVWSPTHRLDQVIALWGKIEAGEETGAEITIAGRLVAKRGQGKLAFGVLREAGTDLQLFVQINALGEQGMAFFDEMDVGDWVGAVGEVIATRRGELSVRPRELTLLTKSLRPLPDKWHGLKDVEQRYRQRELDLVVNEDTRRTFEIRAKVLRALRDDLTGRGFIEVETPMLHPIPGGAT
ncbi:MAG: lysyl-tRNA synthetase class 2, partial [Glaciecola sp.]